MGVNLTELIVIFVVALLLFGPDQLPTLARQLGKFMGEFRKGSNALKREFYNSVYPPQDLRSDLSSASRTLKALKSGSVTSSVLSSLEGSPEKSTAGAAAAPGRADPSPHTQSHTARHAEPNQPAPPPLQNQVSHSEDPQ